MILLLLIGSIEMLVLPILYEYILYYSFVEYSILSFYIYYIYIQYILYTIYTIYIYTNHAIHIPLRIFTVIIVGIVGRGRYKEAQQPLL